MSQRIFIACRSNHDPISVGKLAWQAKLGRNFDCKVDYIRWAGTFDETHNPHPRKCQGLVDCNFTQSASAEGVALSCYNVSSDGTEMCISQINLPGLYQRIERDYAWGERGPKVTRSVET